MLAISSIYVYLPEMLAGEMRLFPDDVSDTCSNFRLNVHILERIKREKLQPYGDEMIE